MLATSDLDWRHYVLHELPDALVHADGKLPRTLVSLFTRPGELAQAFVTGRRRTIIGPLKLYFAAFVLFALSASTTGLAELTLPEQATLVDPTGLIGRLLESHQTIPWTDPQFRSQMASREHWLSEAGTLIIFVFVALLQQVLLIRLRRRYLEHLVLALNVATFYLLVIAAAQLALRWVASAHVAVADGVLRTALSLTLLPVYWYLGIRRFYGIGRPWAAAAAVAITAGNAVIALAFNIAVYALLIVTS